MGSQTLYVYVEGIYDFMGDFICRRPKTECSFTEAPTSAPVKAPTKSPVKPPTSAPTSAPWPCFSKFTEVEVLGQGLTHMDALKIGDAVRTADGSFSTVYSFGHYDPHTVANFLQLWTDASDEPLEITGDHMLFVKQGGLGENTNVKILPTSAVKVGDLLVAPAPQQHQKQSTSSNAVVKVTAITTVQREGLYAPFTTTGSIVVNGVTASNYIALSPAFQAAMSFESQHWLQHLAYLPYRLYCGTAGCQNETYHGETGLSGAVAMWLPFLHWVEAFLSWSLSAHGLAATLVYLVWKQQQSTRQVMLNK